MKFNTIEIVTNVVNDEFEFEIKYRELKGDREDECLGPSPLGFYHYPAYMEKEEAFNKLKSAMIKQRENDINNLMHYIDALQKVTLSEFD